MAYGLPSGKNPLPDLRSLCRSHTKMCVKVLAGIANQRSSPPSARVAAVTVLLERGWGKAVQPIAGDDGGPLRVVIRQIIETVDESRGAVVIEHDENEGQGELPLRQLNGR